MGQKQPRKQRRLSWKNTIYDVAKLALAITTWIWASIIVVLLVQIIPAYLFAEKQDNWNGMVNWFRDAHLTAPWSFLRLLVEIIAVFLVVVTLLAWVFKRSLQSANPVGLEKLIAVLEVDTLSPHLESLKEKLDQQIKKQDVCIEVLERLSLLLQQTPTSSDIQGLHTLSQQQLQYLQKDLFEILNDIKDRNAEQVQLIGDLSQKDQHAQQTASLDLRKISILLGQMEGSLKTSPLSSHQENGSLPDDQQPVTGPVIAVATPTQTQEYSASEHADGYDHASLGA
jgi:hypothetical protein